MKTSLARIFVQHRFCIQCVQKIQEKMLEVQDISNVRLYPKEALVIFNFKQANEVSEMLNTLMSLGYPPVGDAISQPVLTEPICLCAA